MQLPAAGARDEALHQLLKNLNPDEIQKIMAALEPNNQLVMMELYAAHKEQEEARQTPAEKPPESNGEAH